MKKLYYRVWFLYLLFSLLSGGVAQAQVSINTDSTTVSYSMVKCGDGLPFTVSVTNNSPALLHTVQIKVSQPQGIEQTGGITYTSTTNGTYNISSSGTPGTPVFSVNNLPSGESITITYYARALCSIMSSDTLQKVYSNDIEVRHKQDSVHVLSDPPITYTTPNYNVYSSQLLIQSTSFISQPRCVGDTLTQRVIIRNIGHPDAYLKTLDFVLLYSGGLQPIGSLPGQLTGSLVTFSAADFVTLGDNDTLFEKDETVEALIHYQINSCSTNSFVSSIRTEWGCGGAVCDAITSNSSVATINFASRAPSLVCSALSDNSISIKNTRAATTAVNTRVTITIPDGCNCTALDSSTFTIRIGNAAAIPIDPVSVGEFAAPSCGTGNTNLKKSVTLSLPSISADSVVIAWSLATCNGCSSVSPIWRYRVDYQSACCNLDLGSCQGRYGKEANLSVNQLVKACPEKDSTGIMIRNTGASEAQNISVTIRTALTHQSAIDINSISLTGANPVFTINQSTINTVTACSLDSATYKSTVQLTINQLAAGDSIKIKWLTRECQLKPACESYVAEDWSYRVEYNRACDQPGNAVVASSIIRHEQSNFVITSNEPPVAIIDAGNYRSFVYDPIANISSNVGSYQRNGRYVELLITYPCVFKWRSTNVTAQFPGATSVTDQPALIGGGGALRVTYPLPFPFHRVSPIFDVDSASFVNQSSCCSGAYAIRYTANIRSSCNDNQLIATCTTPQYFAVRKSYTCTPGLGSIGLPPGYVFEFAAQATFERANIETPDNDENRVSDGAGVAPNANRHRLTYSDRTIMSFGVVVSTNVDSVRYARARFILSSSNTVFYAFNNLTAAEFKYYDKSQNKTYTFNNLQSSPQVLTLSQRGSNVREFNFMLNLPDLKTLYPADSAGLDKYDDGDSIKISLYHTTPPVLTSLSTQYALIPSMTFSRSPLPAVDTTLFVPSSGEGVMDTVNLIGLTYQRSATSAPPADVCNETDMTLSANLYFENTNNLNTDASSAFLYEYRNWIDLDKVVLPPMPGYTYVDGRLILINKPQPDADVAIPASNVTVLPSGGISLNLDGLVPAPDDEHSYQLKLRFKVKCNAPSVSSITPFLHIKPKTDRMDISGRAYGRPMPFPVTLRINRPTLTLNVPARTLYASSNTLAWDMNVSHTASSPVSNNAKYHQWIHIDDSNLGSAITNVRLTQGGVPLTKTNGFYELGAIAKNTLTDYKIEADYNTTTCNPQSFKIYHGWACDSISKSYTSDNYKQFVCVDSTTLSVAPAQPNAIISLSSESDSAYVQPSDCASSFYQLSIENVGYGNMTDIKVQATLPSSFTVVPGSARVTYPSAPPNTTSQISDGTTVGNVTTWDVSPVIASLPGREETDFNKRRFFLTFSYINTSLGDFQSIFAACSQGGCGLNGEVCVPVASKKIKGYPCVVLPVTWVSFRAQPEGDAVVLQWTTAQEFGNSHFVVEVSCDGRTFSPVSTVKGNGNSLQSRSYSFRDEQPADCPTLYYRIKQVDSDGKFSYTRIASVHSARDRFEIVEASPNPFSKKITLRYEVPADGDVEIQLTNVLGVTVLKTSAGAKKGVNEYELQTEQVPDGVYTLCVYYQGKLKCVRVLK